ncbi:hypothetical_protein [Leishmania infantum]|uniref:Hypothetical_protein n=1 Tax=Leishmania infantum TaxID=5671 RepID=A0A6L0WKK0_LEIIN|nr:hypothetical_protein [Leishmania infantum]SUZ39731.1 hypothetical_protein [Leishmania infantum]
MQRGQHRRLAWVGILFFLVVSLIALCCAVYLRPLSRLTELIYFPPLQAVVHMCSLVFLAARNFGSAAVPLVVWVILPIALMGVPAIALVVVTVLSRHEERRRDDLLQRRLVLGVTAAYVMSGAWEQQAQSSSPTQLQLGDSEAGVGRQRQRAAAVSADGKPEDAGGGQRWRSNAAMRLREHSTGPSLLQRQSPGVGSCSGHLDCHRCKGGGTPATRQPQYRLPRPHTRGHGIEPCRPVGSPPEAGSRKAPIAVVANPRRHRALVLAFDESRLQRHE